MDPLADKILVVSALICLVELEVVAGWMVIVILAREFTITGLRTVACRSRDRDRRRMVGKDQDDPADDCRAGIAAAELAVLLYRLSFCNHYAMGLGDHDHHIRCGIRHQE